MAWENLISAVEAAITANGNNEITGTVLKNLIVNNIIPKLGGYSQFKGVAVPETVPVNQEEKIFYIVTSPGVYANFAGFKVEKGFTYIVSGANNTWFWTRISPESLRQIAETKFKIDPSINTANNVYVWNFYGAVVQDINVRWDKNQYPDTGQGYALTYLNVQSADPGNSFNGRLDITEIKNGAIIRGAFANIFDHGYTSGFTGVLDFTIKPFAEDIFFDIALDCSAIKLDYVYKYGNAITDSLATKTQIHKSKITDVSTGVNDSLFYGAGTNEGKDYPIKYDDTAPLTGGARTWILDAKVFCNKKYRVNFAYLNRTATNTGEWDNTVGINIFNLDGEPTFNQLEYFRRQGALAVGETGIYTATYEIPTLSMKIIITYNLDNIPNTTNNLGHISTYPFYNKMPFMDYVYFPAGNDTEVDQIDMRQAVKMDGENLYIGSKFDDTKDILIWFKKCMYNDLMTFFRVGLADNNSLNPLLTPDRSVSEILNSASSDNIGPIAINGNGWVGGNHSWNEENNIKTAETLNFEFYADGKLLVSGDEIKAKKVTVVVKNRIFDPRVGPVGGADILGTELCTEDVIYTIENGNIFVSLSHTFSNTSDVIIDTYYGMQSMFSGESSIMTPKGLNVDFETSPSNFIKSAYPNFNRFIEKNAAGTRYQSAYLLQNLGLGDHNLVDATENVFVRSGSKTYHRLISNKTISNGTVNEWNGLYNWFDAFKDDTNVLVYNLDRQGVRFLFIDLKAAFNGYVDVPIKFKGEKFTIKEQSSSITSVADVVSSLGLKINSSAAGSLVLTFEN